MPLDPAITYPVIDGFLTSFGILGFGRSSLVSGLAEGLFQYVSAGVVASSVDAGAVGSGSGVGVGVTVPLPVAVSLMVSSFAGAGISGAYSPALAAGVAEGVVACLAQAALRGVHPGVGAGTGILRVSPTGTGPQIFSASFRSAGLTGPYVDRLAHAVATGLDLAVPSATGVLVISGPSGTSAAAGTGLVTLS